MNADLTALIRLQETRDRIGALTERIESEIPAHIAELETELRILRQQVDNGQAAIEAARKERSRLELDLKTADEKIEKYKTALMRVKTNEEYRAALNEIDYTNRARSDLETRVLELMEDVETRREEMSTLEGELQVENKKIEADRKVLEEERATLVGERDVEEKEAGRIEVDLPVAHLQLYRRIASVRGGVALAQASGGICIGCNMRLRPSVFQQVKRNEGVITCDSCGRILYSAPETEAPGTEEEVPETGNATATAASPASGQGD